MKSHLSQANLRTGRLFFLAAFAFCGAAIATGFCFVYAIQVGLERLAMYHPLAEKPSISGSLHPLTRASLTRLELSSDDALLVSRPIKALGSDQANAGAREAYRAFDTTGYNVGKALPKGQPALPWQGGQHTNSTAPVVPLSNDDFVAAIVTDDWHEKMAHAGRAWRQGIRTFHATNYNMTEGNRTANAAHNETYVYYPDDAPLHSLALKGDSRAALVPFMAHKHYGNSYKWLLYGDDDTFFFLDAVMNVLQHLDPDMPYFLTDHMWWTSKGWNEIDKRDTSDTHHPHQAAPLCAPCNYAGNTSSMPYPQPNGCPCTPEVLCKADQKGAILSVGLLRQIPLAWFEDCVTTTYTTGGDAMISICLWEAGFGMTAPDPRWHPRNMTMFDVGRVQQLDHDDIQPKIAHVIGNMLQAIAGGCQSGFCKVELEHLLTLHLRSRKFPSTAAYMETVRVLARLADQIRTGSSSPAAQQGSMIDQIVEVGIRTVEDCQWLVHSRGEGRNSTSAELRAIEDTMHEGAEHKAAYAVALDIVNSIFQRNPPEPERESGASTDKATTEAEAIEKRARVRMQVQADSLLKDLLDENSTAESNHAEAMPDI